MKNTLVIKIGKKLSDLSNFPVVSLTPGPHFVILPDVEILNLAPPQLINK